MGLIEEALREKFSPTLFGGGGGITADFRKIPGQRVKHDSLGIPDPRSSSESAYNTSKADRRELVHSLLGGSVLNYLGHRACVRKSSQSARRTKMSVELAEIFERQDLAGGRDKKRVHRATRNRAWLSAVPHSLNGTELSQEEFRDNLRLRYGLMPQDIPAICDGCGNKFLIEHALSCPKEGLVRARHDAIAKEWGALGARDLIPRAITYKPKIISRTVQRERTEAGARQVHSCPSLPLMWLPGLIQCY